MGDAIHRPDHYCFSEYEPRKVIHSWGLNFNLGNAIKYIARAGRKGDILEDLKKAKEYISFEIEEIEAEREDKAILLDSLVGLSATEFSHKYLGAGKSFSSLVIKDAKGVSEWYIQRIDQDFNTSGFYDITLVLVNLSCGNTIEIHLDDDPKSRGLWL